MSHTRWAIDHAEGTPMPSVLHLSASTSGEASVTEMLAAELLEALGPDHEVTRRELRHLPLLTEASTTERVVPRDQRSEAGARDLAVADELIDELHAADVLVIGAPIYNFGPPGCLKAWADFVARPGETFRFTEAGAEGLVADRPSYVVSASGGTPIGSEVDFGTRWLTLFLGFLGISSVTVVAANRLAWDAEAGLAEARAQIATATS